MSSSNIGWVRRLVAVTSGAAIAAMSAGCEQVTAGRDGGSNPPPAAPPSATVLAQNSADGYGGSGFVFAPALAQIAVSGNVIFRNETGVDHNVTMDGVSHPIAPAATFTRTFNAVGTYAFTCTLHTGMSGIVSVVSP